MTGESILAWCLCGIVLALGAMGLIVGAGYEIVDGELRTAGRCFAAAVVMMFGSRFMLAVVQRETKRQYEENRRRR